MNLSAPFQQADFSQGFFLERGGLRGRLARLDAALDSILRRHAYPESVGALLAEAMALSAVLGGALKYEGAFTLQAHGDGPVSLLVADVSDAGALRGTVQFDGEKLAHAGVGSALLLGKGHLGFMVDPAGEAVRYQGIVDLVGRDMAACVKNYFRKSEQIDTEVIVHVRNRAAGGWQAGALLLQRAPEGSGHAANNNTPDGADAHEERAEDWRRTGILMATLTADELLDSGLSSEALLARLFHEEGLRLDEKKHLRDECRCSRARVAMVLSTIPPSERPALMVDGRVQVKCEYCSAAYDFDAGQIGQIEAGPGVR